MNDQINVRIRRGSTFENENVCQPLPDLRSCDPAIKLIALKSELKVNLTTIIEPVIAGSGLHTYKVCDDIVNNLDLNETTLARMDQPILKQMIYNEILRICIQASSITGKDYAEYLNSQINLIDSNAARILKVVNK